MPYISVSTAISHGFPFFILTFYILLFEMFNSDFFLPKNNNISESTLMLAGRLLKVKKYFKLNVTLL